jgi:hypothetical protein
MAGEHGGGWGERRRSPRRNVWTRHHAAARGRGGSRRIRRR